jgi:diphosphomevalonate decarboxylase
MTSSQAIAIAHPNIALIKFWGVLDPALNLPASGSISITLDGLATRTDISFDDRLAADELLLNGEPAGERATARVSQHLDRIRRIAGTDQAARVVSQNDFPASAGIASSASGFAALTMAAASALNLNLSQRELSIVARKGSGSAARSIFGGFVAWHMAPDDAGSYAESLWPPDHWDLVDWIAVVDRTPKTTGSREGHRLAETSPLQPARLATAPKRLEACRLALSERDFEKLAPLVELDSNIMHAVMLTSSPPLMYWSPRSLGLMQKVTAWRQAGLSVCYTLDAGPTVHCLTTADDADEVEALLRAERDVLALHRGTPGPAAAISPLS